MQTAIMKLEDINPAKYNPRKELKPGDTEYEALKNSLDRFGVAEPLIVNKTTGNLVSGHQRLNVLKELGYTEVEVVIVEVNDEREKLLNIALNKIEGDWDFQKLEALFDGIDPEDIKFTGYTTDELLGLFGDGNIEISESETSAADLLGDDETETEPEKPKALKEFSIFLSFPSKEAAENWLKDRGVETEYAGTARNITIRMEGIDYGTGN